MNKFHRQLITFLVILLFGAIIVSACGGREVPESTALPAPSSTPKPTYEDVVITLERWAGFGQGLIYRLTIAGNGTVVYEGYGYYVEIEGAQTTTISPEQVRELVSEFERVDFFSLNDVYTGWGATDMGTVKISITIDGRTKVVDHYLGDLNAPDELFELERKIEEITNVNQWVGWEDNE